MADILYHYCSNDSFLSIIKTNSIRLSSLSLSSDSREGKLVSELMVEFGKSDKLGQEIVERLRFTVDGLNQFIDGLGFCLSESGDLLSQWRGYAGDGSGVSIGFSKQYFQRLSKLSRGKDVAGFSLSQVKYDREKQKSRIHPAYLKIKELIEKGVFKIPSRFMILSNLTDEENKEEENLLKVLQTKLSFTNLMLLRELYSLKHSAFSEEKEWRLVSFFLKNGEEQCSFRSSETGIVPYRDYKMIDCGCGRIVEIFLVPKTPHRSM